MKFLYDFFPILLFFSAYWIFKTDDPLDLTGIMVATAVAIVASVVQVMYGWLKLKKVEKMHLISMGLIVVLGGLTLILQDETFFKLKPTAVNWLFGIVFLGSQFIGDKPIIQRLMQGNIELPSEAWSKLNFAWAAFFIFLGCVNLYVMYHFSTDFWVNFKLFGMLGLTLAFVIAQAFYLARFMKEDDEDSSAGSA